MVFGGWPAAGARLPPPSAPLPMGTARALATDLDRRCCPHLHFDFHAHAGPRPGQLKWLVLCFVAPASRRLFRSAFVIQGTTGETPTLPAHNSTKSNLVLSRF